MKDIETWLKNRYSEQLIHTNSAFISSIIHDYCTEVVKNNAVLPHVSGSLPSNEDIDNKFPLEVERFMFKASDSYNKMQKHKIEGAKWLRDLLRQ